MGWAILSTTFLCFILSFCLVGILIYPVLTVFLIVDLFRLPDIIEASKNKRNNSGRHTQQIQVPLLEDDRVANKNELESIQGDGTASFPTIIVPPMIAPPIAPQVTMANPSVPLNITSGVMRPNAFNSAAIPVGMAPSMPGSSLADLTHFSQQLALSVGPFSAMQNHFLHQQSPISSPTQSDTNSDAYPGKKLYEETTSSTKDSMPGSNNSSKRKSKSKTSWKPKWSLLKKIEDEEILVEEEAQPLFKMDESLFKISFSEFGVKRELGSGGSGAVVFLCEWNGTMNVALKLFRTSSLTQEQDFSEFEHELNLLSSLRHPNIIVCYGACLKVPRIGIVMEYCENGTLSSWLENNQGKIEFQRKLKMLLDIARGVDFLHRREIIHRDLKSDNCLVDAHLTVKLSDFGLSKRKEAAASKMTKGVGTSHYMSPEVTLGQEYNDKCDVFSFSIIMTEVLLETVDPKRYFNRSVFGIEGAVANDPQLRPIIPEEVIAQGEHITQYITLMRQCWQHDPAQRPNMNTVVEEIQNMLTAQ